MDGSTVIAGTDGSEVSLQAVEWAASEAALRGQPLRIVSTPAMPPRYVAFAAQCPVVVVREETMAVHREVVVGVREP
jgi:hypothetical protein